VQGDLQRCGVGEVGAKDLNLHATLRDVQRVCRSPLIVVTSGFSTKPFLRACPCRLRHSRPVMGMEHLRSNLPVWRYR
jgi:hypothetical protein